MLSYIKADVKRLWSEKKRTVFFVLWILGCFIAVFISYQKEPSVAKFQEYWSLAIASTMIWLIYDILNIFDKDAKARTMQVAIGRGLSREKAILSKEIEFALMLVLELLLLSLCQIIQAKLLQVRLTQTEYIEIWNRVLSSSLELILYFSIAAIIIMGLGKVRLGLLAFLVLVLQVAGSLLELLTSSTPIARLGVLDYIPMNLLSNFSTRLNVGRVDIPSLLGILIYIIGGYFITVKLFKSREMEF